jgi:hypothetical protein
MSSNKVLIESIISLALALGSTAPDTEGKTNAQLVSILNGLKAEKPPEPEPEPEPERKFYIAAGKAITSKRGILSDGDEIKVGDLPDGLKALKTFVKSGHVVKK